MPASKCECCLEEATSISIWIDRKFEAPRGRREEFHLCEKHAHEACDSILFGNRRFLKDLLKRKPKC